MPGIRQTNAPGARDGLLLTGATGFVGMEVLARYLERTDRPVYALVRAADDAEAEARLRSTMQTLFGRGDAFAGRVQAVTGDVEAPGLGLDGRRRELLAERVTDIIHSAASVSFSLPLEQSRQINVEGTRKVLDLAGECQRRGRLRRLSYISTAYVAGTHTGDFGEDDLDVGQSFRNPYERSKFEAERLVRERAAGMPVQVLRPSIIVGERRSGWTPAFNVLYSPLKAFARGNLPVLPAQRSAPVDVVPADYVADAVFELSSRPDECNGTFHLVAGPQATTVGRLIDLSARYFDRRKPVLVPPSVWRRVLQPLLVRIGKEKLRKGIERTSVFYPYFSMRVSYRDQHARHALERSGIRVTPIEDYFERLAGYAEKANWGRRAVGRAEAQDNLTGTR